MSLLDLPLEEQLMHSMPADGPELAEWCRLDSLHREALRQAEARDNSEGRALYNACKLADAKYDVFLRWQKRRIEEFFR